MCHTDGAKAYRWLKSPLNDGTLIENSLKLAHTCVKHKPPHPKFTKRIRAQVWTGEAFEKQVRLGGTQKLDLFFASFRRVVGRRALNTAGPPTDERAARMKQIMHTQMRLFQFKHWFEGQDVFAVLGAVRKTEKEQPGSLSWASLSDFKILFVEASVQAAVGEGQLDSDVESELFEDDE